MKVTNENNNHTIIVSRSHTGTVKQLIDSRLNGSKVIYAGGSGKLNTK